MALHLAFLSIAVFQGIMLGLIILRSPIFKSNANKYLAYAVIGLSFALLSLASELTEDSQQNILVFFIDIFCTGALFPVLVLLFIVNQVDHPFRQSSNRWWLFTPHLFTVAISALDAVVTPSNTFFLIQPLIDMVGGLLFLLVLVFIPGVLLYAYSFIKYADNRREKRWLTQLWFLVSIIMASWVLSILFAMFSLINLDAVMETIALGVIFLIHWTTYVGIFKFRLAKDQEEIRTLIKKWKSDSLKPNISQSSMSPPINGEKRNALLTEENLYFKKLEALCVNERIYLNNTLDRAQVAEMLGISPGYISQLVNTITGDNFSTYINRYRVEAVKAMITNSEFNNYSLLAIGLESGFSSKTTFHTAFKKLTGMTPNMYRKTHK